MDNDNLTATQNSRQISGNGAKTDTSNSTIEHYNEIFEKFQFQMTAFDNFREKKMTAKRDIQNRTGISSMTAMKNLEYGKQG